MQTELLIIFVGGTLVSAWVGYILSSKSSLFLSIRDSLIGGAIGTVLITTIQLQLELPKLYSIRDEMINKNILSKLEDYEKNLADSHSFKYALSSYKTKIEEGLEQALQGEVTLQDQDDVINEWKRMFDKSSTSIDATNYITPNFWSNDPTFNKLQRQVQEAAKERGVRIRRVFIYQVNNQEDVKSVKKVADDQKKIGVEIKYLKYEELISSSYYTKYSPSLGGLIDFVLYDLNTTLLTVYDPETREVLKGKLTIDRKSTDSARDFFEKIWQISSENI